MKAKHARRRRQLLDSKKDRIKFPSKSVTQTTLYLMASKRNSLDEDLVADTN